MGFNCDDHSSRRRFLATSAAPLIAGALTNWPRQLLATPQVSVALPVTALITAYYPVSHADVIVSKIPEGYQRNGAAPRPGLKLVSMYVEKLHKHDISKELAARYAGQN